MLISPISTRGRRHFSTRTSKGGSFSHEVKIWHESNDWRTCYTSWFVQREKEAGTPPPLCSHRGTCFLGSSPSKKKVKPGPFRTQKLALISVSLIHNELRTSILQPNHRDSNGSVLFGPQHGHQKASVWAFNGWKLWHMSHWYKYYVWSQSLKWVDESSSPLKARDPYETPRS